MKKENIYTSRDLWLDAATNLIRSRFTKLGYTLPDKIRYAIAFTSSGKRGFMAGECWQPTASADQHYEIIIRADISDAIEVLAILVHELIHTLLPPEAKHGKEFRVIALRVGLEGQMRQTTPTPILKDYLQDIVASLGPLPHAKLDFRSGSESKKKSGTHTLKAECGTSCGYFVRILPKWAKAGLPFCPINPKHGLLRCAIPDETDDETEPVQSLSRIKTNPDFGQQSAATEAVG